MYSTYLLSFLIITAIGLFIWDKWRYDVVAMFILLTAALFGLVPANDVFIGFSNPAVITVACIMIISHGINRSGFLLPLIHRIQKFSGKQSVLICILVIISGILSAFMNNVGALALIMPFALKVCRQNNFSPSSILMPIAFGSVLGGLCTAIGTPPNLLISSFRANHQGVAFAIFDFMPVGLIVASIGIIFIVTLGWRILPCRLTKSSTKRFFEYLTEVIVQPGAKIIGKQFADIEAEFNHAIVFIGYIRNNQKHFTYSNNQQVQEKDILIIEASSDVLQEVLHGDYDLVGKVDQDAVDNDSSPVIIEAVIPKGSRLEKRSATSMQLRRRFQMNIVGISREGTYMRDRIQQKKLKAGDVVLIQGSMGATVDVLASLGLLPLDEHPTATNALEKLLPICLFAVAILATSLQLLTMHIALLLVVLLLALSNTIALREIYDAIDWPIIVLLAAMLPIGISMQHNGASKVIAELLLNAANSLSPLGVIALVMVITMTLSDVMNNAATAVIMAPIALNIAESLQINPDTLLMAVAISASCSFLTPISHQNNTLVFGPGGYKFLDYLRLGLPLEILIIIVSLWVLPVFWPM